MDDFDKRELDNYRAADTAGLLVRLPVPLGSEVWRVCNNPAWNSGVSSTEIFLFGKVQTPCRIVQAAKFTVDMMDEWGVSVFPTEAEAGKML